MKNELTADRVRHLLQYDPLTGVFVNKVSRGAAGAGKLSGCIGVHGYHLIAVDGRRILGHRLAWLYMTGEWPKGEVDHINGVRADNRFANLRDASKEVNNQNIDGPRAHNTLGLLGVRRMRDKFQARITVDGKVTCLGTFRDPLVASAAYMEAKRTMHPGYVEARYKGRP